MHSFRRENSSLVVLNLYRLSTYYHVTLDATCIYVIYYPQVGLIRVVFLVLFVDAPNWPISRLCNTIAYKHVWNISMSIDCVCIHKCALTLIFNSGIPCFSCFACDFYFIFLLVHKIGEMALFPITVCSWLVHKCYTNRLCVACLCVNELFRRQNQKNYRYLCTS